MKKISLINEIVLTVFGLLNCLTAFSQDNRSAGFGWLVVTFLGIRGLLSILEKDIEVKEKEKNYDQSDMD